MCLHTARCRDTSLATRRALESSHLATAMPKRKRSKRERATLLSRKEDGFYANAQEYVGNLLLRLPSKAGNGTLMVVEHGPWRVLWLQRNASGPADAAEADFFQGVTYHRKRYDGFPILDPPVTIPVRGDPHVKESLVSGVVGFDYQRLLCAASLPFLHEASSYMRQVRSTLSRASWGLGRAAAPPRSPG